MLEKVLETIKKHNLIEEGDRILLGLSGGPDSVCLFHLFLEISTIFNIRFEAIHINHLLRADESFEDEKYVENLCRSFEINLKIVRVDVNMEAQHLKMSIEEAAREIRYREFAKFSNERDLNKIATAHNKNDQAETILMRIIRGTGTDGLSGIKYIRGNIIRPLLDINKEFIVKYCDEKELKPRIDSSNLKSEYTRNKIRNVLIPFIDNEYSGSIVNSLGRLSDVAAKDADFINRETLRTFENMNKINNNGLCKVSQSELINFHPSILSRLIIKIINDIGGNLKRVEAKHIENTIEFIKKSKTSDEIHLPAGVKISRSYDKIIFLNESISNLLAYNLNNIPVCDEEKYLDKIEVGEQKVVKWGKYLFEFELLEVNEYLKDVYKTNEKQGIQFFDYKSFELGINIRSRKKGDAFKPKGTNYHKRIKEFFIDEKIAKEERENIPIITNGFEIAWVVGLRTSEDFTIHKDSKKILKIEAKKIL